MSYLFALAEQLSTESDGSSDVRDVSVEVLFSRLPAGVQNQFKNLILELLKSES